MAQDGALAEYVHDGGFIFWVVDYLFTDDTNKRPTCPKPDHVFSLPSPLVPFALLGALVGHSSTTSIFRQA